MGSLLWDVVGRLKGEATFGEDRAGTITRRPGGVAYNIAKRLADLKRPITLLACLGDDLAGHELLQHCNKVGINVEFIHQGTSLRTDSYMVVEDDQGAVIAVADAASLEAFGQDIMLPLLDGRLSSNETPCALHLIIDGNFTAAQMDFIAHSNAFSTCELFIAPASTGKVDRLKPLFNHPKAVLYCNLKEANILCGMGCRSVEDAALGLVSLGFKRALVTNGPQSACDAQIGRAPILSQPKHVKARLITGAGDLFMATHIHRTLNGDTARAALKTSLDAAADYISGTDEHASN